MYLLDRTHSVFSMAFGTFKNLFYIVFIEIIIFGTFLKMVTFGNEDMKFSMLNYLLEV